jgi:hypothetical protein
MINMGTLRKLRKRIREKNRALVKALKWDKKYLKEFKGK